MMGILDQINTCKEDRVNSSLSIILKELLPSFLRLIFPIELVNQVVKNHRLMLYPKWLTVLIAMAKAKQKFLRIINSLFPLNLVQKHNHYEKHSPRIN